MTAKSLGELTLHEMLTLWSSGRLSREVAITSLSGIGDSSTQLMSIFAKTGTHRQSELALLLTRFGVPGE